MLNPDHVLAAAKRITGYVHHTPLMTSSLLNSWLGHDVVFKVEALQKIGAFKYRGAVNTILALKEQGQLPQKVVAFSSGNHAQAVAAITAKLGIPATVYMHAASSQLKQAATRSYGATVKISPTRQDAEAGAIAESIEPGAYLLHPYDNDLVIAGQGTACLEALKDGARPDAIFCTCSGGGWISGSYLAGQALAPSVPVYAGEPLNANDAARSYRQGSIYAFTEMPTTIADAATSLSLKPLTFAFIRQLKGFYEIPEAEIIYWTQWLITLLKISVEPTSAVAMGAAYQWLKSQSEKRRVLVLLSGGNIAPETQRILWQINYLDHRPGID